MPQITRKGTFVDGRHLVGTAGKGIKTWEKEKWSVGRPGLEWVISVLLAIPVTILT